MAKTTGTSLVVAPDGGNAALPAKIPETKAEKFRRLANGRAVDAIAAIERLGNLGSPAYDYTEDDVKRLIAAVRDALTEADMKLRARKATRNAKREII